MDSLFKKLSNGHRVELWNWRMFLFFTVLMGAMPVWAGSYSTTVSEKNANNGKITITVTGNDTGDFEGEECGKDIVNNRFHSVSFFDNSANRWCYKFYIANGSDGHQIESDINVFVTDANGSRNQIGTIVLSDNTVKNGDSRRGNLRSVGDGEYEYYPSGSVMGAGVSQMEWEFQYKCWRNTIFLEDRHWTANITKTVSQGLKFNYTLMPQPQLSYDENGYLNFKANGVPGHGDKCYYDWRYCESNSNSPNMDFSHRLDLASGETGYNANASTSNIDVSETDVRFSPFHSYAVDCYGVTFYEDDNFRNPYNSFWRIIIPGYVYAYDLQTTEFDQWSKKVSISWKAQTQDRFIYNNESVNRSWDGRWEVYREYVDNNSLKSERIATLSASSSNLCVTDYPPRFDTEYTYRVIFVPTVMWDKDISWFESGLKPSVNVSTKRELPINLRQDRDTTVAGIKLEWDYSIPQTGASFRVERQDMPNGPWSTLEGSTRSVITSQTTASYIDWTPKSNCEFYNYRVVTSALETEFFSNVLVDCNLPSGTRILSIDATKGTEEKVTVLKWTVDQKGEADTYFKVERRPVTNGVNGEWIKVGETHGTATEYTFTDDRVEAGSYYEYRVLAYGTLCEGQVVKSSDLSTIGYSQSRGTVTGHVSYGTGTSVAGVRLNLIKSGTDGEQAQFFSSYINGKGDAYNWCPDTTRYGKILISDKPMSVQLWMAPTEIDTVKWMRIFSFDSVLDVRLVSKGEGNGYGLHFFDKSGKDNDLNIHVDANHFSHLSVTYDGSAFNFYVNNGDSLQTATATLGYAWVFANGSRRFRVGGVENNSEGSFNGLIDEVRLWSKSLSEEEIATNYDRLIGGTENGLLLYWPLDEGINGYAFDVSKQNGISNQNHPDVGVNVKPSLLTPKHLGLYGLTDEDGNYIIRGIPFDAGGTNYKLLPDLGVHQFSPASRSLYISPSSLTANNVDFTDKSSFPMRGYVYYAGTNIPVQGIYLYIDGNLVTKDGKVAETDEDGYYEISVPIGKHFVEAKMTGRHMVNEGRWPTQGTFDFQSATYQNFSDSTLVNFCGRVAGGQVQNDYPVGFGKSTNNIGTAVVTLGLNNPNFSFNCVEGTSNNLSETRAFNAQNRDTIKSTSWAGAGEKARNIFIQTDPETGEFSAMLPPLNYTVSKIEVPNNPLVAFADLPEIDMTNPSKIQVDTLINLTVDQESDTLFSTDPQSYRYNEKLVSTWYATPTLEVTDALDIYNIGAFGLRQYYGYEDEFGKVDSIEVYRNNGGAPEYLYGYPIYKMMENYAYRIIGYEQYVNNDDTNGPKYDNVPLAYQVLTVNNEMSADQRIVASDESGDLKEGQVYDLQPNQLALDSAGTFIYQWRAGYPNTLHPYTRHVGITYKIRNRTYTWDAPDAYVFGTLPLGNNFVTKGPDEVLMVLRDPPGSNSSTTWTRGKSNTKIDISSDGTSFGAGVNVELLFGSNVTTETGLGLAIITSDEAKSKVNLGFDAEVEYTNPTTKTWTISTEETISTSSDPEYVGANGDVYIGVSTNLILGDCKKVGFFRESAADKTFEVLDSLAISVSDSVTTSFMFSQREIELKQIPEWKKLRASLLQHVDSKKDAEKYENNTSESVYVTWHDEEEDLWIPDSTYMQIPPKNSKLDQDMVAYYTSQVEAWETIMANNEKDKVKSMSPSSGLYSKKRNFSFDSGSKYTYTEKNDTTRSETNEWNYKFIGKGDVESGFAIKAPITTGFDIKLSAQGGYVGSDGWGHADENYEKYAEFTYNLEDSNIGVDFTVDSYKSLSSWTDVFSVLGGQTYCPYEGEVKTEYYEPGRHTLSNATEQMQRPQIHISNGSQLPSNHAELTDVPAGQTALFNITLYNDSEFDLDQTFVLGVSEETNPDGLQILVDGIGIGNGRAFVVEPGTPLVKTLQVRQTDLSILDYENVTLYFVSDCQDDAGSVNGMILNECTFGVHFKPSSSPVTLKADEFVVNTLSDGKLNLKLTDFDRNFQNLKRMGVEYKSDGASSWTLVQNYVFNKADSTNVKDIVVSPTGDETLIIDMSDSNSYPDGTYIFRAFTETPYGVEQVRVYSEEVNVVKDMRRPTAIGTPLPADGILNYGDDLMVEFNEDIIPSYVEASNIQVTGKLNRQATTHEVSLHLSGNEPTAQTENDLYLRGNSTVALWLKYTKGGTIFRHCAGDNALTFGIDESGHLTAKTAGIDKVSALTLPKNEWVYMAYSYDAITTALNMVVQHGTATDTIQAILGEGRTLEQVAYADDKHFYLGGEGMEGDIHGLRIYSITRNVLEVAGEKYDDPNSYKAGMMAYWPLDEGQGLKARDLRNDAHPLTLRADAWRIDNVNYAAAVDSTLQQHLDINIGTATTDNPDSYALEFWFRADGDVAGKTLFQAGTDMDNNLCLYGNDDNTLMFGYGAYVVPVSPTGFNPSGGWHHFALNVMRGSSATVAIDGKRTAVFAENDVPPMEGGRLVMGAGFNLPVADSYEYKGFMSGAFDEVRIWKGFIKPEVIKDNMYNCLDTLSAGTKGLTVYYPMEEETLVNNVNTITPSAVDMAPGQSSLRTLLGNYDLSAFSLFTPPLKNAPQMQKVINSFTVSDRKIAIELQPDSPKDIEGSTLDITVTKIFDKNGNPSNPITWQVYVHQNTLEWEQETVSLVKNYGEMAEFDVVIENSGNSTEQFTISNLPVWLSTDDVEGELPPLSSQTIRFEVSKLVAVGQYDVNLSLTGNNGIAEPLRVVMRVKGEAPDWTVDTDKYEDIMNMVAQVLIDGIVSENPESRLAAFLGEECVGVASPEKSRGSFYVPMTIYGSGTQHKNQPVTFKFWDASTNLTYVGMNADPAVLFKKDSVKGSFDYPVIITNTDMMEQNITAKEGWNWISMYVLPEDNSINSVMVADALQQGDALKSKTEVSYYDGKLWSVSDLDEVNIGQMYKLQVQQPVSFTLRGNYKQPSQMPVTVNYGWNWIGFTPTATMPINEALGGSGAIEGDYIKSKREFAIYGPYGWEGNLKALEPGKGYMLFAQRDGTRTFTYPDVTQNANAVFFMPRMKGEANFFSPVDENKYPDNMSIVARLVCDGLQVDTAEIAAFIDNECRATARANDGLYWLMVQGEDSGQLIQLCMVYNGEVVTIDQSLTFIGDANVGLPWSPYVIDISEVTGVASLRTDDDGDTTYYLPNGIQVEKSMLHSGQVYIVRGKTGKTAKYMKK